MTKHEHSVLQALKRMDGTDLRQIRVVRQDSDVRKQQQTEDTVS